ncbi:MAG: cell division protein SepF [Clostridiales bacterium]|nr:cell division protein SepF [Clostridiales bacterium]
MGVMDKFLNAMRLNSDEDDYYDDEFYDEEDEEDYIPPRRFSHRDRRRQEDEPEDISPVREPSKQPTVKPAQTSGKVTPMRPSRRTQGGQSTMEVCVVKPTSVEDAREITETLLAGRIVVLNLEGLDLEIAQRIIDFTSGSCYAIAGNLQKISHYIFTVTPHNVDISGDFQNIVNAFDTSSLQTDI